MKKAFYTSVDRYGNAILFRGYVNGVRKHARIKYQPTVFIPSDNPTKYKTLQGRYVKPFQPGTMRDSMEFFKKYEGLANMDIFGNANFIHQFISDNFMTRCSWDKNKINISTIDIEVESDKGFPDPKHARMPITAITMKNNIDNVYYVWAMGNWSQKESEVTLDDNETVHYVKCLNEHDLLKKFLKHWVINYPDIVTGWNSRLFDMTYIVNRIQRELGEKAMKTLSPWGLVSRGEIIIGGGTHHFYNVTGIQQLDYLDVFRKYGYMYGTQESYKLDHIANVILGERKLDYSEYGSLMTLYKENHQKFIDYNIRDVQVVDRIEEKTGLLELAMTVAYKSLTNLSDCFGSVQMWDSILYNEMRRRNIVVPPKKSVTKERQIEGAFVKDPIIGMHDWVMSFDLNSLYPHIIMQYNMSPETIVNKKVEGVTVDRLLEGDDFDIEPELSMCATGQYFTKTIKGIIPELIQSFYNERSGYKREMIKVLQEKQDSKAEQKVNQIDKRSDDAMKNPLQTRGNTSKRTIVEIDKDIATLTNKQLALKILMNSLYGALSNEYFRYYDMRMAEGITITGQYTIRSAEKAINQYLNKHLKTNNVDYVIAIDTDSLYINFGPLVKKVYGDKLTRDIGLNFLNKLATKELEPLLEETYLDIRDKMNCKDNKMVMKREVIADKGIWTGKKHYTLNVLDSEGVTYKEPQLKIMGIEAVRSSTPLSIRNLIKDTIKVIMEHGEKSTQQFIEDARKRFYRLPPEEAAFPRGVANLDKYKDSAKIYRKSTPIQVRAALLYNYHLVQLGLDKKYDRIFSGDKIKFVYLKLPNRVKENVIAFITSIPEEFKVKNEIDYEKQFEKGYLEPMRSIIECVGWKTEKQATLEEFF